ncbi:MAG: tyrosine-type recombinase/integrase [Acidimicrobiales bacterium]
MNTGSRDILDFECGVSAYEPPTPGGYWRLRWVEGGRRRDTTARSREAAIAKAAELVERLAAGTPIEWASARGAVLVAHYLDPTRPGARGRPWSERHREDQEAYCRRFVTPVIAEVALRSLTRAHLQAILDEAPTASVAAHLRRCLSAMVAAALEEGLVLARQDVLRGVHWHPPASAPAEAELERGRAVEEADIPTAAAVHALARAAAGHTGVWWRELEILLVAYSGLRWGEHAALTVDRLDAARRRIVVDRQVVETRRSLKLGPPKSRRKRTTMYPARTPAGVDLAALVGRRLGELGPDGVVFPSPRGRWARRSNYRRNVFDPAAAAAGWPRRPDGRWQWSFHSLRHVFATWALDQPGARIADVSRLLGHSTVRVTQDLYIAPDGDLYDRFFTATA